MEYTLNIACRATLAVLALGWVMPIQAHPGWAALAAHYGDRALQGNVETRNHTFNVTSFGAKGDGKANDTSAFRSAIAAACDGSVYGAVFVPPRHSFRLSANLVLPANCKLAGGGTIEWFPRCNCSIVIGAPNDAVEDITFNGENDIGPGVYVGTGAANFRINHNTFENFQNGALLIYGGGQGPPPTRGDVGLNYATNNEAIQGHTPPIFNFQCGYRASDISFVGNVFVGDGDFDIGIDGCSEILIKGNQILPGENGYGGAIQVEATSDDVTDVKIADNIIHGSHFANGYAAQGINLVTNGSGRQDDAANVLSNFLVEGNVVYDEPSQGINLTYVVRKTDTPGAIADNVVYGNRGGGIKVVGRRVSIIGNMACDNYGFDLQVSCDQCLLKDNFMINN